MPLEISSWLTEVCQYLHNNTVGVFGNTPTANIFRQTIPNSPVLAIGVFARGGPMLPEGIDPLYRPSLQVLVRGNDSDDGLRRATTIWKLLNNKWNITPSFNGRITADHLPGAHYFSTGNHPVYTLNFTAVLGRRG